MGHQQHGHGHDGHGDHAHAGPKLYWIFAAILCVITFFEWFVFKKKDSFGLSNTFLVYSLLAMSLVKFVMVVGWYMHLRFDHKLLTKIFVFSALLAIGVFVILQLSLPPSQVVAG